MSMVYSCIHTRYVETKEWTVYCDSNVLPGDNPVYGVKSIASDTRDLPLSKTNSPVCDGILSPHKEGAIDSAAIVRELVNPIYDVDGTVDADDVYTAPFEHQYMYDEPAQEPQEYENPVCSEPEGNIRNS